MEIIGKELDGTISIVLWRKFPREQLYTGRSEADLSAVIMAEIPQKAGILTECLILAKLSLPGPYPAKAGDVQPDEAPCQSAMLIPQGDPVLILNSAVATVAGPEIYAEIIEVDTRRTLTICMQTDLRPSTWEIGPVRVSQEVS